MHTATDKRVDSSQEQTDKFLNLSREYLRATWFHELVFIIDKTNIKFVVIKVTDMLAEKLYGII